MYFSGSARNELASAGVFSSRPSNSELRRRQGLAAGREGSSSVGAARARNRLAQ